MKKLYILLLPALLVWNVQAQIEVTRADFGQIGDQILYAHDTSLAATFSVGTSGEDKTWDYNTGNVSPNYYDQSVFVDPTQIPGSPEEANIAIVGGTSSSFYNIDENTVRIVVPLPGGIAPNNPIVKIASFPMTYGSVVKDSTAIKFSKTPEELSLGETAPFNSFDSIRVSINVNTNSLTDGWGMLKIDNDSFSTLRVKNDTKVKVKIEGIGKFLGLPIVVPIQTVNQNQLLYVWYGNDKKYALAQATIDSNGQVASFQYQVKEIKPLGLDHLSKTIESSIQPNPANDELHLNFNSNYAEKGTLMVVDITGKVILSQAISIVKEANDVVIKTTDLNNGIYFSRIVSEHINTTSKFVVRH